MPVFVNNQLVIPDGEIEWKFTPSGGPGGQHANRSSTRVELRWPFETSAVLADHQRNALREKFGTEVRLVVDEHRSQLRNRATAKERLAIKCRAALTPKEKRRATKPSRGSQRRRLEQKRRDSQKKSLRKQPSYRTDY